jgi:tetratricopeptide (TPR) repeat protein
VTCQGPWRLLDSALEKSPKLYDAWQLKGDMLATQGDAAGAMAAYRKALEVKPDYLPAHAAIIRMLLAEGKLDEAGKQTRRDEADRPNHPQTHYLRAMLAYQKKDYPAARDAILLHAQGGSGEPSRSATGRA